MSNQYRPRQLSRPNGETIIRLSKNVGNCTVCGEPIDIPMDLDGQFRVSPRGYVFDFSDQLHLHETEMRDGDE